jgi:hypothetical protein
MMLQAMHYILDVEDMLCSEAFQLLKSPGENVSLRNLATFLIAVDNIMIPSMTAKSMAG